MNLDKITTLSFDSRRILNDGASIKKPVGFFYLGPI